MWVESTGIMERAVPGTAGSSDADAVLAGVATPGTVGSARESSAEAAVAGWPARCPGAGAWRLSRPVVLVMPGMDVLVWPETDALVAPGTTAPPAIPPL